MESWKQNYHNDNILNAQQLKLHREWKQLEKTTCGSILLEAVKPRKAFVILHCANYITVCDL